MINFNSKPYEWQKHMEVIMENADLEKIQIQDNSVIQFDFLDCYKGNPYKTIQCQNVLKFSFGTSGVNEFPLFIGDVRLLTLKQEDIQPALDYLKYDYTVPESDELILICINSGEVSISIICGKVEILDVQ